MLIFLKLGGSLTTDKEKARTTRPETIARLMGEIASACAARSGLRLVLGHGSGSFGHVEGKQYGTREGVRTNAQWRGFADVQAAAGLLNRAVLDAAREAGLPVVNFPPSASVVCQDGLVRSMSTEPIRAVLGQGLIPLVFGDVAVDEVRGGTIVSTEDVFRFLAPALGAERILLAGIEPGVLSRWPDGEIVPELTPKNWKGQLQRSHVVDVTGGMEAKVQEMMALVERMPRLEALIFSGDAPGRVRSALLGEAVPGTRIYAV
jgi:isopentenyl phosphate kinase